MKLFLTLFTLSVLFSPSLFAWGTVAHKYINKNATVHLPPSMQQFIQQASYFETNAMVPDNRRDYNDKSFYAEQYLHFLDIDYYPNFKKWVSRDLDSLRVIYGNTIVKENGLVPWVTKWLTDSLSSQLKRGDWQTAYATANDIGHYVADAHVPLHATVNYNGQLSNQIGIHSRHESTMITNYQSFMTVKKDSVRYIDNIVEFAMQYLLTSQSYVDSVLSADLSAKSVSGWNGSGSAPTAYYTELWSKTNVFTLRQIQSATIDLASIWYTAYVNAGLIAKPTNVKKVNSSKPKSFNLQQNYPNPFNPKTTIQFEIARQSNVKLNIISIEGKTIASLVNNNLDEGSYSADWDATRFASGVYLYRLETENYSDTKKFVLLK